MHVSLCLFDHPALFSPAQSVLSFFFFLVITGVQEQSLWRRRVYYGAPGQELKTVNTMGRHLKPRQVNNVCTVKGLSITRAILAYTSGNYSTMQVQEAADSQGLAPSLIFTITNVKTK